MLIRVLAISLLLIPAGYAKPQKMTVVPAVQSSAVSLEKLTRLIENRKCGVPDYTAFTEAIQEGDAANQLGMVKVKQDNSFLEEYRLKTPIRVFNRETARICFASAGVMAIFTDVKPEDLAKELNLAQSLRTQSKVMFARTVKDQMLKPDGTGLKMREIIRLNVSTVTSHPGCVLAGCEYRIEVQ